MSLISYFIVNSEFLILAKLILADLFTEQGEIERYGVFPDLHFESFRAAYHIKI